MARQPRFVLPGHPQHIIIRGNNREAIFYRSEDYQYYLERMEEASLKHSCLVHAYVLMTNHVHLLVTPEEGHSISKMIQMLGRYYVQYFNYAYKRTGTLWEGRYKAALIDSDTYLFTCQRYIELNPVRAGMVKHCAEYPWSSYRFNALGVNDSLLTPHYEYIKLAKDTQGRQAAYRALFSGYLDELSIIAIREATNKAWVLGSDYFKQQIESKINRQLEASQRGGDRRSKAFNRV